MIRPTFTAWFVQVLACAGVAFFAWKNGVPQTVYANDMSMMTSVIAALFVGTVAYLGRQAWLADNAPRYYAPGMVAVHQPSPPSSDFGHSAERWSVMLGLLGTTLGLSLQAKSLAGGSTSFGALATSLFTTGTGIVSALLIGVMVFSLEAGIRRARK